MLNMKMHGKIRFLEYLPDNNTKKPLMIYLHGAGERGDDLLKVNVHGPIKEMLAGKIRSDFVVLAPQCGEGKTWWDYAESLYEWLVEYIKNPFVDEKRVYLTGNSMGGYGTWALAMAHPELFAAVVPICGGGLSWNAGTLKDVNVWAFHCVGDRTVPCSETIDMVEKVKEYSNKDVKITIYPICSHDAWTETYQNQKVYDWLLEKGKNIS